MKLLLVALAAGVAFAQTETAVDNLERRALGALAGIKRAETWEQVISSRPGLRARLEQSLGLSKPGPEPHQFFLYEPSTVSTPAPAVVLVRPHTDPALPEFKVLPLAMAELGIVVVEIDAYRHHSRFDRLAAGLVPQSLIQRDVRSALAYLKTRRDVDAKRLGLVGEGLAVTLAAGLNSEFTAAVLLDGASDLRAAMGQLRLTKSAEQPDSCHFVPGMLLYAATEELLSMIAPRPLLLLGAADRPLEYVTELYRWGAGVGHLQHAPEREWTSRVRRAAYDWLSRLLGVVFRRDEFIEPMASRGPLPIQLNESSSLPPGGDQPVSADLLKSLFGAPLPRGAMAFGLKCGVSDEPEIDFYPQRGIKTPVTSYGPSPNGCGPARGNLFAIDDRGRNALTDAPVVREALRRGWRVWTIDPRGIGRQKTELDWFAFGASLLLGENFAWRQSWEIVEILRFVRRSRNDPTALYARGKNMSLAALYAAAVLNPAELQWVVLEDAPATLQDIADLPLWVTPFNGLQFFDIADLMKAAKPEYGVITDPHEFIRRDW